MKFNQFGCLTLLSGIFILGFSASQVSSTSVDTKQLPRPECNNGPVMFGHRNFEGRVVYINRSYSSLSQIDFNNKAGSACVPSGWTIELFKHENFNRDGTPTRTLHGPGSLNFFDGSGLNNEVSSVRIYQNGQLR